MRFFVKSVLLDIWLRLLETITQSTAKREIHCHALHQNLSDSLLEKNKSAHTQILSNWQCYNARVLLVHMSPNMAADRPGPA